MKSCVGLMTWIFLLVIVGLPERQIVLIPLHDLLLSPGLRHQLATNSRALWFAFGSIAAGNLWKALLSWVTTPCPRRELKQRVRWDVYILVLRAVAMFVMAAQGLAGLFSCR